MGAGAREAVGRRFVKKGDGASWGFAGLPFIQEDQHIGTATKRLHLQT